MIIISINVEENKNKINLVNTSFKFFHFNRVFQSTWLKHRDSNEDMVLVIYVSMNL